MRESSRFALTSWLVKLFREAEARYVTALSCVALHDDGEYIYCRVCILMGGLGKRDTRSRAIYLNFSTTLKNLNGIMSMSKGNPPYVDIGTESDLLR